MNRKKLMDRTNNKKFFAEKGSILIVSFLILGVLLLLGVFFISFSLTESKIVESQEQGIQAYYLAEAGINQAIWKLRNDQDWKDCFISSTAECDCNNWSASFTSSTDDLIPNSHVSVTIENLECARARIVSTSTVDLKNGKTAQRLVKTVVFKSQASPTEDAAIFSGGSSENIEIQSSKMRIFGNIFCNNNLNIKSSSVVEITATSSAEGNILVAGNYIKSLDSSVSANAYCAGNLCQTTSTCACQDPDEFEKCEIGSCPPKSSSVPLVDFNSSATTSFKTRAQNAQDAGQCQIYCKKQGETPYLCSTKCVFTTSQFEDLLWEVGEEGTLTLNTTSSPGIIYVEGQIEIRGGRHLIINGALVADSTINVGTRYKWSRGAQKDEGFSHITVNRPTATTTAGILSQAKINFGSYSSFFSTTTIVGVIYANDEIRMVSLPGSFDLIGGIVGRKLSFISLLSWFNFFIDLDNEIIRYGLGYKIDGQTIVPQYSPIINIEHWEEEY